MAGLAHRKGVAEIVCTTGAEAVHFPCAPQHRGAAAGMVAARFHGAFAPAAGTLVEIVTELLACGCRHESLLDLNQTEP